MKEAKWYKKLFSSIYWHIKIAKLKNKWEEKSFLVKIMLFIIFVSIIMVLSYSIIVRGGFSRNPQDWGSFGSFFASITGLLAFTGVLYTASLSEKRADEEKGRRKQAEKKAVMRDERDLFFKILQMHQYNVTYISLNLQGNISLNLQVNFKTGRDAIAGYVKKFQKYYYVSITLNQFKKANCKYKDEYSYFDYFNDIAKEAQAFSAPQDDYGDNFEEFIDNLIQNNSLGHLNKYDIYTENECQVTSCYSVMMSNELISINDIYCSMKSVADYMYDSYEHQLGQYFRTICHLQEMATGNIERKKYIAIFISQLSREELVLLLYYIVGSQIESKAAQMFFDNGIFENIFPENVLGCNYKVDQEKDKDKQREIVNDFIKDLLSIKAEESKKKTSKN